MTHPASARHIPNTAVGQGRRRLAAGTLVLASMLVISGRARGTAKGSLASQAVQCREENRYDSDRAQYCEIRERTIRAARELSVDAGQNGGVIVHGENRPDVRLVARVQAWADDDAGARDLASRVTLEIDEASGRISADGPRPRRHEGWSVSFELWTPRGSDLRLEAHNGGLAVDDVDGTIDLRTVNGGLTLDHVSGDVRGETTNGGVRATLDGDHWRGAGLDLQTTNGGVTLTIPSDYSGRLETGTVNGGMDIDFPITVQGSIRRRITTQLGKGGATIRAFTTNGGVAIRRG